VNDLKLAIRQLQRNPGFAAVAVLTLALGIGANTAIFSVVNAVLLRPLPFREPDRLVTLWERNPSQGYEQNMPSPADYLEWKATSKSFDSMAIFNPSISFALTGDGAPARIEGASVSPDLFDLLGVRPQLGRGFAAEEMGPGRDQVVVISHTLWAKRFAADRNAIGKSMVLDGVKRTIVGVMPPGFRFPGGTGVVLGVVANEPADVWLPLTYASEFWQQRSMHFLQVIGRLAKGVRLEQAMAEISALQGRIAKQNQGQFLGTHVSLVPLHAQSVAGIRSGIHVLWGAVLFILMIACTNVANLCLARANLRQREFAVRLALGAGRRALFRQLLSESLLLSMLGGGIGVLLAYWGVRVLRTTLPATITATASGWNELTVNGQVLLFTLVVSAGCAAFFALVPFGHALSASSQGWLKQTVRGTTAGVPARRWSNSLVVAEIAFALVLLTGAALMIQSFVRLVKVPPGFEPARLVTVSLTLPEPKYTDPGKRRAFFEGLVGRVQAVPGVARAGMSSMIPFGGAGQNYSVAIDGRPGDPDGKFLTADFRPMTPDYFRALGVPLVTGRMLSETDIETAAPVVLVNETFVRRYLGGGEPLGRRISTAGGVTREIVGVVRDFKQQGLDLPLNPQIYPPLAQAPYFASGTLAARARGDARSVMQALRHEVAAIDPDLPIDRLETMEAVIAGTVAQPRLRAFVVGLFGGLAVVLAALGIYGVSAHAVAMRQREFGIRLALGAQRTRLLDLVMGHGLRLALLGVAIGLAGALALTRVIQGLLFDIAPSDPLTLVLASVSLVLVALLASWLPARGAAKVDPIEALRCEG
jgi:putative ABC transport system permease protein